MAAEKKDVLKLRIAKRAFLFRIKKKFSHVSRFSVKKKKGIDLGEILSFLTRRISKKKPEERIAFPERPPSKKPPLKAPPVGGVMLKVAAVIFLLIILAVAGLFLWLKGIEAAAQPQVMLEISPEVNFSIDETNLVTYGKEEDGTYAITSLVSYSANDMKNISLDLKIFPNHVPQQIFLLLSQRYDAECYPAFVKELREKLGERGIAVNEIDQQQIETLPEGAVVIIPSGYIPTKLLGMENNFTIRDMLKKGLVIIYIGFKFDGAIDENGTVITVPPATYGVAGVSFRSAPGLVSTPGFNLYDPTYTVESRGGTGGKTSGTIYGSVSTAFVDKGYIIFLPQTLNGGWKKNGTLAALDVARIIEEDAWQAELTRTTVESDGEKTPKNTFMIRTPFFDNTEGYGKFYFEGIDKNGGVHGITREVYIKKTALGELYSKEGFDVVPTSISGNYLRMTAVLKEPTPRTVKLSLETVNESGVVVRSEEIQAGETSVVATVPFDYDGSLSPGEYELRLVDAKGKRYAQSVIDIAGIDVRAENADFKKGDFSFSIYCMGSKTEAQKVDVSVDNVSKKTFSKTDTVSLKLEGLKEGTHLFTFDFGTEKKTLSIPYRVSKQFYEEPLNIFLMILAAVIAGVGYYLRKPEKLLYSLDVPDFPPVASIRIPVKRDVVLDMFDKVNTDYRWKWMPLSIEELKNGFRKLSHLGRPILIGDYNLERILGQLVDEGHVFQERGYYGLRSWEEKAERSSVYLSTFREMRDVFVNKAVGFTPLGVAEECDTKASIGQYVYMHIAEDESVVGRALGTVAKGLTVLVFKDVDSLISFKRKLASVSRDMVALKMEIDRGRVILTAVENLPALVDELKP
jgi:hypothetical protein